MPTLVGMSLLQDPQFGGPSNTTFFLATRMFGHYLATQLAQTGDDVLHQHIGRRHPPLHRCAPHHPANPARSEASSIR